MTETDTIFQSFKGRGALNFIKNNMRKFKIVGLTNQEIEPTKIHNYVKKPDHCTTYICCENDDTKWIIIFSYECLIGNIQLSQVSEFPPIEYAGRYNINCYANGTHGIIQSDIANIVFNL